MSANLRSLVIANWKKNAKTTILLKFVKNDNCKISKCRRRHPRQCKYFESGYCKFKESCKYDHTEKLKVDDLLDRLIKLEKQNGRFRETNEQQEYAISVLNERLSKAEMENKSLLRKLSKEHEEEKKADGDTMVTDDHMETSTNTNTKIQKQNSTEVLKNQIKLVG